MPLLQRIWPRLKTTAIVLAHVATLLTAAFALYQSHRSISQSERALALSIEQDRRAQFAPVAFETMPDCSIRIHRFPEDATLIELMAYSGAEARVVSQVHEVTSTLSLRSTVADGKEAFFAGSGGFTPGVEVSSVSMDYLVPVVISYRLELRGEFQEYSRLMHLQAYETTIYRRDIETPESETATCVALIPTHEIRSLPEALQQLRDTWDARTRPSDAAAPSVTPAD